MLNQDEDLMGYHSNFHGRLMKLLCPRLQWSPELDRHFAQVHQTIDMFDDPANGGQMDYQKELIHETRQLFNAALKDDNENSETEQPKNYFVDVNNLKEGDDQLLQ